MPRIKVDPAQIDALGARLQQIAGELHSVESRVGGALGRLDWEARQKAGVDGQVNHARSQARTLASQAEEMSRYLAAKAQVFEEADRQGVIDLNDVIRRYPVPTPTPTPDPDQEDSVSVRDAIEWLDDRLKPIDWVSDHKKAARMFREALRQIGRILNSLMGKRGHIKLMEELGDVLTGSAKAVSATSDLFALGVLSLPTS